MVKFNSNFIGAVVCCTLSGMYYIFGVLYFFSQGNLVNDILNKNINKLNATIILVVFYRIFMLLSDVFLQNLKEYFAVLYYKKQMLNFYPEKIFKDFKDKSAYIFDTLSSSLNSLYMHNIDIMIHRVAFIVAIFLYLFILYNSQFIIGGISILIICLIMYFFRNLYNEKIELSFECVAEKKKQLLIWNQEYFDSYREIFTIWSNHIQGNKWFYEILNGYLKSRLNNIKLLLIKNLLSQLIVEMPFIILICSIFLGVYYEKLTITEAFLWIGASQFILAVSQNIAKNQLLKKYVLDCKNRIDGVREMIADKKDDVIDISIDSHKEISFTLQKNHTVILRNYPGIYYITGDNGIGKTTLLDTILGYCRDPYYKTFSMNSLKMGLTESAIRIITTEAIAFSVFPTLNEQIIGIIGSNKFSSTSVECRIALNLADYLSTPLIQQWVKRLQQLRLKFDNISGYQLSLGERVMLSCLRNWFYWDNEVKLLLIDECDACLDAHNKALFHESLSELRQFIAIFIISHTASLPQGVLPG